MEKENRGDLHGQMPLSPLDIKDEQSPADVKDEQSKEAVWNLATLPQGEEQEDEAPKNKFLSKRTEAVMMTAICAALFGEWVYGSMAVQETDWHFLTSRGVERRLSGTSDPQFARPL